MFTDLHEHEIRVVLYRGLNMCHLCCAQIDLPDVWGMNLVMGERIQKFYWVTSARGTGAAFKQGMCENEWYTTHTSRMDAPDYSETRLPNKYPLTQIQCVGRIWSFRAFWSWGSLANVLLRGLTAVLWRWGSIVMEHVCVPTVDTTGHLAWLGTSTTRSALINAK